MTGSNDAVEAMLGLGASGTHPASAVAGIRTAAGTDVAAGGWASLPSAERDGVPMRTDSLVDWASVTKVASTTVLVMLLVAEGRVDLHAPARRYLSGFDGEGKSEITVEQLLTHSAGLQPWWPLYCETDDRVTALERARALPLIAAPGSAWRYSDIGLMLTGEIVEQVTGLGLADAFRQLVAVPLGLTAAGYGPVEPDRAAASSDSDTYEFHMIASQTPFSVPFTTDDFVGWRDEPVRGLVNDGNTAHALGGVSGHAGLFAPVDDLLTLGAAVRGGEFIPRAVLERFSAPSESFAEQAVGFRRLDLSVGEEKIPLLCHSGFTGTFFGFALDRELVVAGGAMRLYGTVGSIATGSTAATPPADLSAAVVPSTSIITALLRGAADSVATIPLPGRG
jgi:CubicO group peptidase (beta-lactamase class C family)